MEKKNKNKKQLPEELEELRIRLEEAEDTLNAIRSGEVDAIVVSGPQGDQVFTLTGAERAYRVLIETMNEGAASLNQEGLIIYCNQRLSEMIKTPLEKVIGAPMRQFIRASDLPVFASLIEKGLQESSKGEVSFIQNDGTVLPALLSISALQRDNANMCGIIVTDLTAQKHIEEELRRHRDNLEELVKDRTYKLETSNQQLQEEITKRKQAEEHQKMAAQQITEKAATLTKTIGELAASRLAALNMMEDAVEAKKALEITNKKLNEEITKRIEAEEKIKEYTENLEEKVRERTRALEDINLELRVLNEELELRRQEAEYAKLQSIEASRAKTDFLANMSHELRTPLNSIIGFSGILQDELYGKLNAKQREYISDILGSGTHLLELINDILDLAKVEAGKLELALSRFPLKNILNISMSMLKEEAIKHDINLSLYIKPEADVELEIEADERKLKQIMFNLLSNALKFTPEGGSVSVQARLTRDEGRGTRDETSSVVISVEDTGIGIEPEDIPKLFKEFSQIESVYTKTYEGTGLGLALTKRLVELFGGRIWVESEFGKGSKFTFMIPVKQETKDARRRTTNDRG